jgi:phosphate transport system protein
MCALAGAAMERATQALLQSNLLAAERIITDHDHLAPRMQTKAEESAFVLLALQAPGAEDLRLVVGMIQNVAHAERMGGLAVHVAKLARRRHPDHAVPEDVNGYFAEMGSDQAIEAILSRFMGTSD